MASSSESTDRPASTSMAINVTPNGSFCYVVTSLATDAARGFVIHGNCSQALLLGDGRRPSLGPDPVLSRLSGLSAVIGSGFRRRYPVISATSAGMS
jgi:hypothetical protein